MSVLEDTRQRVTAVIEEIERLKQSDFPYTQSRDALSLLEEKLKHQYLALSRVDSSSNIVNDVCSVSLFQLHVYVPILGFILRSTDVRNAFESYGPLLRLAQCILDTNTKLIISSEWEFSPFVYRSMSDLPGFVLIGLPAPESSNPLLISLAGHEIGHAVWETEHLFTEYEEEIKNRVLDELTNRRWQDYNVLYPQYNKHDLLGGNLFTPPTWMLAYKWALLQTEEVFCDFFGLRVFSESYLNAFSYLISPGLCGERPLQYPTIKRRISHLVKAAEEMRVQIPTGLTTSFLNETEPTEPATKLLVSVADAVSASLVTDLIKRAQSFADEKAVPSRDSDNVKRICEYFLKKVVPTTKLESLCDIINSGWNCIQNPDLWNDFPQIKREDRHRILKDIVFKSMEVAEIYERLRIAS